ncbi:MAG: tetratricopeptide repeat protein [Magnetococcales bacterium]|nr:tetratricopeptide repeat protein [Magnetococcales bacterium]
MKRLRLYLFLFALVTALGMVNHATAGELDEIYRLTDEKKLDQAMKKLDAFLQEHPRDAEARFLQGLIFTGKSQNDEAIRVFRELGKDFPDLPEPFNNLAVLYAERGDYENARQSLQNAIRILPDYATAHENLGDVYAKLASQSYAQALRINASNAFVSSKQELLKKLFVLPNVPTGEPTPVIAAKAAKPAAEKPAPEKKAAATPAAAPPSEPAVVQNVADTEVRAEVDPAAKGGPEPEAEATAPATTAAAGSVQAELERTVEGWAKVWAAKQVDEYLAFYSETYTPEKFPNREAWKQQRRLAISAAGAIKVKVANMKVTVTDASHAQVTFMQSYWSRRYQDQVSKTLVLQKEGAAWKIVREY